MAKMHDMRIRRMFENMVHSVVLDANPVLKTLVVPGYYIPKIKALRLTSILTDDELFLTAYGALMHHLHPKTPIARCRAYAVELHGQLTKQDVNWVIAYLKRATSTLSVV
jgi:hypothetical protein